MWMMTQTVALNTSLQKYYTGWFPKGADNAVFTKNREDEGSAPGTAVGTFTSLSAAFHEVACAGLKDLVRFEISFMATAVGQGVILRFLPPTWYDTAV